MIASLLASAATPWRRIALILGVVLLIGLAGAVGAWKGYRHGYAEAEAKGQAELQAQRAAWASSRAKAEADARRMVQAEAERAADITRNYLAARRDLAAAQAAITNQRISHASRDVAADSGGVCTFGPEWVRLYNEAIGAAGGGAVPGAAAGFDGTAPAADAPDAGVLPGAVTPEDVLAHIRDYGGRCRALEAQLGDLITWAEGVQIREAQ